jgi:hypothetical protein
MVDTYIRGKIQRKQPEKRKIDTGGDGRVRSAGCSGEVANGLLVCAMASSFMELRCSL